MGDHREEPRSTISPGRVQRIAIIGGGPAGIAAAKYLLAENAFSKITIYEERPSPGGVWLATPDLPPPAKPSPEESSPRPHIEWPKESYSIPQPSPKHEPEPVYLTNDSWQIESPIYNALTTNLPKQLMRFTDLPFPDDAPLMPRHEVVKEYLKEYTKDLDEQEHGLVKWGRRVTSVVPLRDANGKRIWEIKAQFAQGVRRTTMFNTVDAVVIANGHYTSPFIPDIPGVRDWCKEATQSRIIHSKSWRHPPPTAQKILIIGAGISGMDIADHIAKSGSQVLLSSRTFMPAGRMQPIVTHENIRYVHPVSEFLVEQEEEEEEPHTDASGLPITTEMHRKRRALAVRFSDGSVEEDIDQVIFATGYFYDYPFFTPASLASLGVDVQPEARTGLVARPVNAVLGLWQHLIARDEPTLSFLGLPSKIVPFPVVEVQSALVARLLAGRLSLPPKPDMLEWETRVILEKMKDGSTELKNDIRELVEEVGKGNVEEVNKRARRFVNSDFHILQGTDAQYINDLSTLCSSADRAWEAQTGFSTGKAPPFWDAKTRWMRRMAGLLQKVMREGDRELVRDIREVEEVLGTFEYWMEVQKGGEGEVEVEKGKIVERFGCAGSRKEEPPEEPPEGQDGY